MRELLKANTEWKAQKWNKNPKDICKMCFNDLGEEKKYRFMEGKCMPCYRKDIK